MSGPKYQTTKHRVRIRPRMRSIRADIRKEYEQSLKSMAGAQHELLETNAMLRAELQAERRITLRMHLARWWREGPWPHRWRTFTSH